MPSSTLLELHMQQGGSPPAPDAPSDGPAVIIQGPAASSGSVWSRYVPPGLTPSSPSHPGSECSFARLDATVEEERRANTSVSHRRRFRIRGRAGGRR